MARKTKENIAAWVATAVRAQFDVDVPEADAGEEAGAAGDGIETTYEHSQGDYDRVRAHLPGIPIDPEERYAQAVGEYTIRFEVLDADGDDYLLRVRVD